MNDKNGKGPYWIGFDLGGTKMLAVVYDRDFKPIARERKKTRGFEGKEAGLARMEKCIGEALDEAGIEADELAGIGFGCPGPVDLERGVVVETPNLGWGSVPVKKRFEAAFKCPVAVANDVDAGLYGEYRFGVAKGARCAVGLFPGTGIGGACIYEGRIFRGANISCMEVGHIPMQPEGPLSGTGQYGELESVSGRLTIAAQAAMAAYRGDAPHLRDLAGTDLAAIRSGGLAEAIKAGDTTVEHIVHDAAEWLGRAAVTIVYLMAPDVIVLGGGLAEAMPELMKGVLEETLKERLTPAYRKVAKVQLAELGDDAGVLGAAAWVERQVRAEARD